MSAECGAEKDVAPCACCGSGNAFCFMAGGWCCLVCESSGGMSHEPATPAAKAGDA